MKYAIAFVVTALVFCAVDAVWLGLIAADFYRDQLGALLLDEPNFTAVAIFYLLYMAGIVIFAIAPALTRPALHGGHPLRATGVRGALFGLFTYMTYDLTNLATLRGWSWTIVAIDIAWGMALTALGALAGAAAARRFMRWQELSGVVKAAR